MRAHDAAELIDFLVDREGEWWEADRSARSGKPRSWTMREVDQRMVMYRACETLVHLRGYLDEAVAAVLMSMYVPAVFKEHSGFRGTWAVD